MRIESYEEIKILDKKIITFGAGKYFSNFVKQFPLLAVNVEYVIDNDVTKYNSGVEINIYGKTLFFEVFPVEKIINEKKDSYIIIFCFKKWKEMKCQIDSILNSEYDYAIVPLCVDYSKDKDMAYVHRIVNSTMEIIEENKTLDRVISLLNIENEENLYYLMLESDIVAIPRIPVVLTPKCSLKCKDCNNLMWAFTELNDLDVDIIIDSLKKIIMSVDFVGSIELIGGEPFLARGFCRVLDFLKEQEKVLTIEITTNATIIPNDLTINSLKNNKVRVNVSNYAKVVNQNPFINTLKENDVKINVYPMERWISPGGTTKRNRNIEALKKQYYNCGPGYKCKTLWEDKLYPCARAASLAQLRIYEECAFVDIDKQDKLADRIVNFYLAPTCGACDYCDMALEEVTFVEPAVQRRGK